MLTYRPTTPQDTNNISLAIQSDPQHRGKSKPEFWADPSQSCFTVSDEEGPVFYVRSEKIHRMHIQFNPVSRKRLTKAIDECLPFMVESSRKMGFKQIIFDSIFKPLIRFLQKRGFKASPNEFIYDI